jgi:hypothetical protein
VFRDRPDLFGGVNRVKMFPQFFEVFCEPDFLPGIGFVRGELGPHLAIMYPTLKRGRLGVPSELEVPGICQRAVEEAGLRR